jgi:hypothetical protein
MRCARQHNIRDDRSVVIVRAIVVEVSVNKTCPLHMHFAVKGDESFNDNELRLFSY